MNDPIDTTTTPAAPDTTPAATPRRPRPPTPKQQAELDVIRKSLAEQAETADAARGQSAGRRVPRREFDAEGRPKSNPRLRRENPLPPKAPAPRSAK
jgi:hypothetical protein